MTETQSQSPEKVHSATALSRSRVLQSNIRQSPGVLQRRGRKDWRSRRGHGYQENTAHRINSPGPMGNGSGSLQESDLGPPHVSYV